jgi:hypothetical protein
MVADLVDECGAPIPHRSSHGSRSASPGAGILRGGADRRGQFFYGGLLAAVVNSKRHMLISYTRGNPTTRILEWNLVEDRVKWPYVQEIGKGSASNPDRTDVTKGDLTGEIYKLELDGTIVGRFGRSDNSRGTFKTPHFIRCMSDDELIEISIADDFHFIRLLPR